MKLYGRLIKGTRTAKYAQVEENDDNKTFHDKLEDGLISLCKELDIQVPVWLKKNTTEFAMYHRTFFEKEQFVEDINFDKFEIRIEL